MSQQFLLTAPMLAALGLFWSAALAQRSMNDIIDSAERGDVGAQVTVVNSYARANYFDQDNAEDLRWYRLAAVQGNLRTQMNRGVKYGYGVLKDPVLAFLWFNVSATNENELD